MSAFETPLSYCPLCEEDISVFHHAVVTFHSPSDSTKSYNVCRESIRACRKWRQHGESRYDCVAVATSHEPIGLAGLRIGRVMLFFSFYHDSVHYPCFLTSWYRVVGDAPDADTGMWVVERDFAENGSPSLSVELVDSIVRAVHLIPVYGRSFVSNELKYSTSLNASELLWR